MTDSNDPTSTERRNARRRELRKVRQNNINAQLAEPGEETGSDTTPSSALYHPVNPHPTNRGAEWFEPGTNFYGAYSKGLPHFGRNESGGLAGEVRPDAYRDLAAALDQEDGGDPDDFDNIPEGSRPLANPEASLSYNVYGLDSNDVWAPAPPGFDSEVTGAELTELYWMALLRDVRFADYPTDERVRTAATEVADAYEQAFEADSLSQRQRELFRIGFEDRIEPRTLFRGNAAGVTRGPYISQFLLQDFDRGIRKRDNRQRSFKEGVDFLTEFEEWLAVQNGEMPNGKFTPRQDDQRHIITGRDLATFVRANNSPQQFLNAAFYLQGLENREDRRRLNQESPVSDELADGFVDYGRSAYQAVIAGIHNTHLRCGWYHKWRAHRRLRPEEYGGRIRNVRVDESCGDRSAREDYALPDTLGLGSGELPEAIARTEERFDTVLLPQGYAVGSPTHPSYPAGHGVTAGASATLLKAFFNESFEVPQPVQAVERDNGETKLVEIGSVLNEPLTVESEANKLAANTHLGRNFAGIHYRSDGVAGMEVGERIATSYLLELLNSKAGQSYDRCGPFTFTRFDGQTKVRVNDDTVVGKDQHSGDHIENPFDPPLYERRSN